MGVHCGEKVDGDEHLIRGDGGWVHVDRQIVVALAASSRLTSLPFLRELFPETHAVLCRQEWGDCW